ncbi:MAG TPA: VTT domain-containing protein [Gammaproteobacteria bacterium]|nr:VTT domain-containing protein [Gammaproteobacteria bacterium]
MILTSLFRAAVVVVVVAGVFLLLDLYSGLRLGDSMAIRRSVEELGAGGPFLVIALIATAIVMTPIPSAPIALAAGAAYGHLWGTLYVALGAEIGALTAFGISRFVGYEVIMARFGDRIASVRLLGSQTALMWTVFGTRLVPFISFDIVSYAAGLTPLTAWRFAAATLLGIVPASFVLAHFGTEITSANPTRILGAALALGLFTGAPLIIAAVRRRKGRPRGDTSN